MIRVCRVEDQRNNRSSSSELSNHTMVSQFLQMDKSNYTKRITSSTVGRISRILDVDTRAESTVAKNA